MRAIKAGNAAVIRRHLFTLRLMLMVADATIAGLLFVHIGTIRFGDADWNTMWQAWGVSPWIGPAMYAAAWVTTLWFLGLYDLRVRWNISGELNDILVASFLLAFATMSFLYLVNLDVSRLFLLALLLAQPLVTIAGRLVLRMYFDAQRARGYDRSFMVIIGVAEEAQAFADAVESHRALGIQVIGHLRAPGERDGVVSRPILGDGEDLVRIFHERVVDEVGICVSPRASEWSQALVRLAADEGKHIRIPTRLQPQDLDLQSEVLDGLEIRSYVRGPTRMLSLAVKRVMDVAGAAMGLVFLSPVFGAVALGVLIVNGRPILFRQTRVGLHGRLFTLYKFRTMVADAEDRYEDVVRLSDTKGAAFKMEHDPRVTRLGSFLRRSSLDELPQMWNVGKGDMSLIGPRPAPPREVAEYDIWHRRRLSMRPGITGLWQVGARMDAHFDDRAHLDLAYIDGWSLLLDVKILLKTVPAVVGATGK